MSTTSALYTTRGLLDLPTESMQLIWGFLFEDAIAEIEADLEAQSTIAGSGYRVVATSSYFAPNPRSAQVLRTSHQIFHEACPVFMKHTRIVVNRYATLEPLLQHRGSVFSDLPYITQLSLKCADGHNALWISGGQISSHYRNSRSR